MKTEDESTRGMYQTIKYEDIEENDRKLQEHFQNEPEDYAMYEMYHEPQQNNNGSAQMFGSMKKHVSKYKRKMKDIATLGFKHSPSINEQQPGHIQQGNNNHQQMDYKFQPLNNFTNHGGFENGESESDAKKRNKMTEEERKEKNRVYARQHRAEKKKQQKMLEHNNKQLTHENKSLRQILVTLGYSIPLQNQMIQQQQIGNNNLPPPDMQHAVMNSPNQNMQMGPMQPHPQQLQNMQMVQMAQQQQQQSHQQQLQQQQNPMYENEMNQTNMVADNGMGSEINMNVGMDPNFDAGSVDIMMDPNALDPMSFQLNSNNPSHHSSRNRFKTIKKVASFGVKSVKNVGMKGSRMVAKAPRAAYNFMFNHHNGPSQQNSPPPSLSDDHNLDLSLDASPQLGSFQPSIIESNIDLMDDTFDSIWEA